MPDVTGCNGSVTVYSPSVAGHGYEWFVAAYEFNSHPPNPTQFPDGPSVYLSNTSNHHPDGLYKVYYIDYLNGVYQCTSNTFDVYIHNVQVKIVRSSSSLPSTLKMEFEDADFYSTNNSYQWYRNGVPILGANSAFYAAELPGDYHCQFTSSECGTRQSNAFSFNCGSPTYSSNYTFPTGVTTISNTNIVFDGTITIPAEATLNFINCIITMTSCSEIIIERNFANQNDGGRLYLENSIISSCENWKGIYVKGYDNSHPNDNRAGGLTLKDSKITDAMCGILADDHAYLDIDGGLFKDNVRHIHIEHYCYWGGNPNVYIMTTVTIKNLELGNLLSSIPSCPAPGNLSLSISTRKMVYLNDVHNIEFYNCTFNGTHDQQGSLNMVYSTGLKIGFYNKPGLELKGCKFTGDYDVIINMEDGTNDILIEGDLLNNITSYIHGNFKQGIRVVNTINCYRKLLIGMIEITHSGTNSSSGIYIKDVCNYSITECNITYCTTGIEMYSITGSSFKCNKNTLMYNQYGIAIANVFHPVSTSNQNGNYFGSNYWNSVELACNKILYNVWGIVGSGQIPIIRVDINSVYYEWETFFHYSTVSNASTQNNGDMAWYCINNNLLTPIQLYTGQSVYTYPMIQPNKAIMIDGYTINSNNMYWYINLTGKGTYYNCRGTFKTDYTGLQNIDNLQPLIYPNPTTDNFEIRNNNQNCDAYIHCSDINGKAYLLPAIHSQTGMQYATDGLVSGIYIIQIPLGNGNYLYRKLVKY